MIVFGFAPEVGAQEGTSRSTDAGQIERSIKERELPAKPQEPVLPEVPPTVMSAPEELKALEFVLASVSVEGATVFSAADFVPLYQGYLGQTISSAAVEDILKRITQLYREAGYFLSRAIAPPQDLKAGVLRIQIIEGYVDRVVFEGPPLEREGLDEYTAHISGRRPLSLAMLE